jgi:hypothetical protein
MQTARYHAYSVQAGGGKQRRATDLEHVHQSRELDGTRPVRLAAQRHKGVYELGLVLRLRLAVQAPVEEFLIFHRLHHKPPADHRQHVFRINVLQRLPLGIRRAAVTFKNSLKVMNPLASSSILEIITNSSCVRCTGCEVSEGGGQNNKPSGSTMPRELRAHLVRT